MKRVFYYLLCAVLCVSMLSAAIPVRVMADEGRQQEATAEQTNSGAADVPGDSPAGDINTNVNGDELRQGDSDLINQISNQSELQASLTSDMSLDTEQATRSAVSGYQHSDSATSGSVTLTVEWNDPVLGQPTTFHVSATGGSGNYLFRMDAPSYSNPNEYAYEPVADPSRGEWTKYTDARVSHDFTFTTMATGTYNFRFYLMDKASGVYYLRTNTYIQVADDAYPSVASIIGAAVSQAKQNTNGSEYEMALYLHDWLLDQLEYDNSLKWSSAESALTRGLGTCQAYESAYAKLLSAAGIENAETRDTYDGHTWNAVKLDGEWYQVDCTWDDTSDNFYADLDQRHLYFCLTDELMAIAHPGHGKIYTSDNYATRSNSLMNNYYVRNGKADEWAGKYVERIQKHLDAREESFSIDADNQSFPPSISGIQNGIIVYAMNQREWKAGDAKAKLTAASNVTTTSSNKWTAKYDFKTEYQSEPSNPKQIVPDGEYAIANAGSATAVLDISGCSSENGANAQLWKRNGSGAQRFRLTYDSGLGAYEIVCCGTGLALDVKSADFSSGANVQQYSRNGTAAQRWLIEAREDGTYTIASAGNPSLALDAKWGSTSDGTNVRIFTANGTSAQGWKLVPSSTNSVPDGEYAIANAGSATAVLDISGCSSENGANAQLWKRNGSGAQRFRLTYDSGLGAYEIVCCGTGLALDVKSADFSSGANVQQYSRNGTAAQRWLIEAREDGTYTIASAGNPSLALDAKWGSTSDGTNVRIFTANGTSAQGWKLVSIAS